MAYFYAPEIPDSGTVTLSKEESTHLSKTLRAKVGDEIQLLNGNGHIAKGKISSIDKRQVCCDIMSVVTVAEPDLKIHLYLAPPRSNIMSGLVKQCVELGVWSISLIDCEFSVSKPKDKSGLFQNEIIAAAKQSRNPFFPKVNSLQSFKTAFENCPYPKVYGAVPNENVDNTKIDSNEISLWIGPEGGFSPSELKTLQENAQGITIGNWVLRVETACVGLIGALNSINELK